MSTWNACIARSTVYGVRQANLLPPDYFDLGLPLMDCRNKLDDTSQKDSRASRSRQVGIQYLYNRYLFGYLTWHEYTCKHAFSVRRR